MLPKFNYVNDFKYESIFPIYSCLRSAIYYNSFFCVKFVPLQKFWIFWLKVQYFLENHCQSLIFLKPPKNLQISICGLKVGTYKYIGMFVFFFSYFVKSQSSLKWIVDNYHINNITKLKNKKLFCKQWSWQYNPLKKPILWHNKQGGKAIASNAPSLC
jgi:hypothetical protein